jgi:hypothetical protein
MLLSTLSDFEFASLVAHYNSISNKDKYEVSSAVKSRGYSPEVLAKTKSKFAEKFNSVESCGIRFTKPFGNIEFENFDYFLTLFQQFERGHLPYPGSVSEQPAKVIEIFSVLKLLQLERELKNHESVNNNGRHKHQNQPRAGRQGSTGRAR